jgi:two-component sensor histidine kinase
MFTNYDIPARCPGVPRLAVELAIALILVVTVTAVRLLIDRFFPAVVPYPLVFPAIAVATIAAGPRCGAIALVGGQMLAWYFIVPYQHSFAFANTSDLVSLILATAAQTILLWFVASYREAERNTVRLRQAHSDELERLLTRLRDQADLNEQLLAQELALRETRNNLEAIYQASADGLALCEAMFDEHGHVVEYQVLEVNRAHGELTAATREQMLTKPVSTIAPPIDPRWFETAEKVLKTGIMHDFDVRSPATGRWLNIRTSRVSDRLFQQTFVDISERHRLEEQRRMLLKEMSHRVTNNFQMVASFLQIQAAAAGQPAAAPTTAAEHLNAAARRVQVLAKLHSLLAYSESEGDIDTTAYIQELCRDLPSTFPRPEAVTLVCESDELQLPAEMAVTLGFIISELVTNSAKYAYPPPASGSIQVLLRGSPEAWTLVVRDRGQGFRDAPSSPKRGLGTRLVMRFVQQIGAEITTTSDDGVEHSIVFPPRSS